MKRLEMGGQRQGPPKSIVCGICEHDRDLRVYGADIVYSKWIPVRLSLDNVKEKKEFSTRASEEPSNRSITVLYLSQFVQTMEM